MKTREDLLKRIDELEAELAKIRKTLPICSNCHDIRDKDEKWRKIADFLHAEFGMNFTHSICPGCAEKLYPEFNPYNKKKD